MSAGAPRCCAVLHNDDAQNAQIRVEWQQRTPSFVFLSQCYFDMFSSNYGAKAHLD